MDRPLEIESTRSLAHALGETNWGWEIPVYLFLGGLVAGLLLSVGTVAFTRGAERVTEGLRKGVLAAPILLSLGMGALFLDLTYKLHVWRFYTAFRPAAPMSWGSWILLLVYPVMVLLLLAFPPAFLGGWLGRSVPRLQPLRTWAVSHARGLGLTALASGGALGAYTGLLLSATGAQPLWSSGALAALFLASGASGGVALLLLFEREHTMTASLARVDVALIVAEVLFAGLWLAGLLAQGPLYRQAAGMVLWGSYAPVFLGLVVFGGLVVPASLESLALSGRAAHSRVPAVLVLLGGLILRAVIVSAGQALTFYPA